MTQTHSTTTPEMSRVELVAAGVFLLLLAINEFYLDFIVKEPIWWPFGHHPWAPRLFGVGFWVLLALIPFYQVCRLDHATTEPGEIFGTLWGLALIALLVLAFV